MPSYDSTWIQERIDATKALIVEYEAAMLALSSGAQSYTLNTGETSQTVMKSGLGSVRETLSMLENRLAHYQAKLCGSGVIMRPGF
jgi:hypothetical protein